MTKEASTQFICYLVPTLHRDLHLRHISGPVDYV